MTCGWRVPSGAARGGRPPQLHAHQLPAALLPGGQGRGERGTGDRELGRPTSLHPPTLAGGAQEPRPGDVRAVPLLRLRLLHDAHADHACGNVGEGARGRLPGNHRSWTGEALDEARALAFSLRAARTSLQWLRARHIDLFTKYYLDTHPTPTSTPTPTPTPRPVDLFSKDYIFVPLHLEDQQWSLAVVCRPGLHTEITRDLTRAHPSSPVVCRPGLWAQQQTNMTTSRFSNGGRNAVSAPAAAAGAEVSEPAADFSGILYLGPLRLPPSSPGIMKLKWYLEEEYKYKMSHRTAAASSSAEAPPPVGDPRFRIMTVKHVNGAQVNGALRLLDPCDSALYMLKFIEKLATHASALKPPLENSPLFSWRAPHDTAPAGRVTRVR